MVHSFVLFLSPIMATCSSICLDSTSSQSGDYNSENPAVNDSSAYEIPELSQTAAVPEVSVNSVYTELRVNPYETVQEENTDCMDREPGYVNTTQQYSSNTAGLYDN